MATHSGSLDGTKGRKRRIVSISLQASHADWIDVVVQRLRGVGYRSASRSEALNVAVHVLRETLTDRTIHEILKVFLDCAPRS